MGTLRCRKSHTGGATSGKGTKNAWGRTVKAYNEPNTRLFNLEMRSRHAGWVDMMLVSSALCPFLASMAASRSCASNARIGSLLGNQMIWNDSSDRLAVGLSCAMLASIRSLVAEGATAKQYD